MKNISPETRKEIESYMEQNLEDLLCILSLEETSRVEGLKCLPGQEQGHGERIFEQLRTALHEKVCVEWEFCAKRHDPDLMDSTNLVAAVADVVATPALGFPPVLISTILCKKGPAKFCRC